jgi:perosamine synthetase
MSQIRVRVGDFRLGAEEKRAINKVLDSGRLSEGPRVREFERRWAEYVGTDYCIATSSGTAALILTMAAMKLMSGNAKRTKVITSPLTYIATSSSISNVGWEPIYCDVDPVTFAIDPDEIERHLAEASDPENYALILPVHLMGYPADMGRILDIGERHSIPVAEDSAQAHGTLYDGKRTGSMGQFGAFSFYIAHNIQAGEMGAATTDNAEIARLARKLKAQGRECDCPICVRAEGKCPRLNSHNGDYDYDPRFTHDLIGYNFKTMEFQAALGLTQLDRVDWILSRRQQNVQYMNERLAPYSDLLQLPPYSESVSYLAYPLVIKQPERISRRTFRLELEKRGIETRPLFGSIPTQQPAYAHLREQYAGRLPNADYLGLNAFYVGCHQYLTEDDLDYMADSFIAILEGVEE